MEIKTCNSLKEVRDQIDALDGQLVELIAARNAYIHQAAKFKHSIDEVKAPDRIDDVINRARSKAIALNLSPNLVTKLFEIMIDEMVESEIAEFRNRKAL